MIPDEHNTNGLPPIKPRSSIPEDFRLQTYTYELPPELIAQTPARVRDQSRLLALHRNTREIRHQRFSDLPSLLLPSDLLVINETKVTPASLIGRKLSGGRVELLVLDPVMTQGTAGQDSFAIRTCLVRSSKRLRQGAAIQIEDGPK
jgi:S-adenosylmethionine:tRNA ribosyltransferase-isomerase